jgi:YVTN family beta-propeller protein
MKSKTASGTQINTFSTFLRFTPTAGMANKSSIHALTRVFWTTSILTLILLNTVSAASFAYVTNLGINSKDANYNGTAPNVPTPTVAVIDTATNNVITRVPIGEWPIKMAVNPARTKLYVASPNIDGDSIVYVIDTATNTVNATAVLEGASCWEMAINPRRSWEVYLTTRQTTRDSNNTFVYVVSTATKSLISAVKVGLDPSGVVVTPDGKKIYVANSGSGNVSVIDVNTKKVTVTVPVEGSPDEIAITPNGKKAYVGNLNSKNISVIDTATDNVIASVPIGKIAGCVKISPDGKKAYAWNFDMDNTSVIKTLSVIDTNTENVIATVPVGNSPRQIAISPDGKRVYVGNFYSKSVTVIDTKTNTVIATVPVGEWPMGIAVTPDGKKVYVANAESDNVSVIDTATNTVTATVYPGIYPTGVLIVPLADSNTTNQSINVTPNVTENIGIEETNFSSSEKIDSLEINNSSNNISDSNKSEPDNGSNSENESSKKNSIPGLRLLGSLSCLYGGRRFRKR